MDFAGTGVDVIDCLLFGDVFVFGRFLALAFAFDGLLGVTDELEIGFVVCCVLVVDDGFLDGVELAASFLGSFLTSHFQAIQRKLLRHIHWAFDVDFSLCYQLSISYGYSWTSS